METQPHPQRQPPTGPTVIIAPQQDPRQFNLCCCHIRGWALGIGIFELICAAGSFIRTFIGQPLMIDDDAHRIFLGIIICSAIWALVVILFLIGVAKERRYLLLPHMIVQAILIAAFILLAGFSFYYASSHMQSTDNKDFVTYGIVFLIVVVVCSFFWYAIFLYYRFLREKQLYASPVRMVTQRVIMEQGYQNQVVTGNQGNAAFPNYAWTNPSAPAFPGNPETPPPPYGFVTNDTEKS